jgi:hypothetical protein
MGKISIDDLAAVHNNKYTGDFLLLTGNSELFTKDILELDNEQ